jgi:endonuclease YncB( thermonuclease family)
MIRVDAYGPDRYKRILAVIWDKQINVNPLIVAMGYAEVYGGAPCQVYYHELGKRRGDGSAGTA